MKEGCAWIGALVIFVVVRTPFSVLESLVFGVTVLFAICLLFHASFEFRVWLEKRRDRRRRANVKRSQG